MNQRRTALRAGFRVSNALPMGLFRFPEHPLWVVAECFLGTPAVWTWWGDPRQAVPVPGQELGAPVTPVCPVTLTVV